MRPDSIFPPTALPPRAPYTFDRPSTTRITFAYVDGRITCSRGYYAYTRYCFSYMPRIGA